MNNPSFDADKGQNRTRLTVFSSRFQDLEYLSSGLEGRSANPVALLFDSLTHPDADIGMETASMLKWRRHEDKAIDHVVLGKMPVGGAWQVITTAHSEGGGAPISNNKPLFGG